MKLVYALLASVVLVMAGCNTQPSALSPKSQVRFAFTGPDVLWRPRENMIFSMADDKGTGFTLNFTVRDMNTYVHAPAPVFFAVVAPDNSIVARHFLEDDGITGGDFKYQDGIYDPFADFRYRQYHRVNSPGGMPLNKQRSPFLTNPESLPLRKVTLKVPAKGSGLYRVFISGRWDHWISITPSRPMATGVHPGTGPLAIHGSTLNTCYFYLSEASEDVGLAVTEEVTPYGASLSLKTAEGKTIQTVKAKGFATYLNQTIAKNKVYRVDLSGMTPGACLHAKGFPMVLCPDTETARKLHGGVDIDSRGRTSFHSFARSLNAWADTLTPADLNVNVTLTAKQKSIRFKTRQMHISFNLTLDQIAKALETQVTDPDSSTYGLVKGKAGNVKATTGLAFIAGYKHKDNPYYGNAAVIRRVLLADLNKMGSLDTAYSFNKRALQFKSPANPTHYFHLPMRSNWYGLGGDANHITSLLLVKDVVANALPTTTLSAWKQGFELWALGRTNMHVGEVSNQWGYNMQNVHKIYQVTGNPALEKVIRRHAKLVSTTNLYGRLNPDETPFDRNHGRLDTDCGLTPAGYMPEQMGFDGEYTCEQTMLWGEIWKAIGEQGIVDWFSKFNTLKTYLTLSKNEKSPTVSFSQTCSPTDLNFRTRYMTHKNHQPKEMVGKVDYLDLWKPTKGAPPVKPWPFLEKGRFTKVFDNKFFCLKRPDYYGILYGGPRLPLWANWSAGTFKGNSVNFDGPEGPGYGGWGMKACKPGGISALYVTDCGPVLLGQNHTVMDSNTVWGKATKPLFKAWRKQDVDPTVFAACYGQPDVSFDEKKQVYTITEKIPFTPLVVTRVLTFQDKRIKVGMTVKATEAFTCKSLNYSLPFFADKRSITKGVGTEMKPVMVPESVTTPSRPRYPTATLEADRWTAKPFMTSRLSVTAKNGKGIDVVFTKEATIQVLKPFRYRAVAPAAGSFVVALPTTFKQGEVVTLDHNLIIK